MTGPPFIRDPWRSIHDAIRGSILSEEFAPGSRLVEQDLANRYGTSRGPVRTALQELERSGLVVSYDRRGTFVRSLSRADVEEIFSLWEVLFAFAVRRAHGRITAKDRIWIEDFLVRAAETDEPAVLLELSIELAQYVFRIAKHARALGIFESLIEQARTRSMFRLARFDREYWQGRTDFEPFCRALLEGDVDAVLRACDAWVRRSKSYWPDAEPDEGTGDGAENRELR